MKFARMLTVVLLLTVSLFGLLKLELVAQESPPPAVTKSQLKGASQVAMAQPEVDRLPKPESKVGLNDEEVVTKSYYVGDLVVNNKKHVTTQGVQLGGVTQHDFMPLKDLIKATIASESWKNQGREVEPYAPDLSLIISNDEANHKQIEDLLTKLRQQSAITIELDSFVAIVPEGHELAKGLTADKPLLIEEKEAQRYLREFNSRIVELPKRTLHHGQMMTHHGLKFQGAEMECLTMLPMLSTTLVKGNRAWYAMLFCTSASETQLMNGTTANKKKAVDEDAINSNAKVEKQPVEKTANTEFIDVPNKGYARFDVTAFLKNPKKGIRAIVIAQSTVHDKIAEIAKIPAPKVLKR